MHKIVIGNIKMNLISALERERYFNLLKKGLVKKDFLQTEIVICPPVIYLEAFQKKVSKKIKLGAQNGFWEEKGSYTGEISISMLKNFGCEYMITGHSERRRYFYERDEEINLKILSVLRNGLKPILCVGENKEQREEGAGVVMLQLKNCLKDIDEERIKDVVICYEPVWAISSNNPDYLPSANDIMSAKLLIRKWLIGKYGIETSEKVRIIYGGSVSSDNAKEVCLKSGMDGVLVGKESLKPQELLKIANIIEKG